jgi:hypothetical protein
MAEYQRLGNAGFAGNLLGGRAVKALAGKQRRSHGKNLISPIGGS